MRKVLVALLLGVNALAAANSAPKEPWQARGTLAFDRLKQLRQKFENKKITPDEECAARLEFTFLIFMAGKTPPGSQPNDGQALVFLAQHPFSDVKSSEGTILRIKEGEGKMPVIMSVDKLADRWKMAATPKSVFIVGANCLFEFPFNAPLKATSTAKK